MEEVIIAIILFTLGSSIVIVSAIALMLALCGMFVGSNKYEFEPITRNPSWPDKPQKGNPE